MLHRPQSSTSLRAALAAGAAVLLGFAVASPALAHDELGTEPEVVVPQQQLEQILGTDAEANKDDLYRIPTEEGPDLLTHGPDLQLDAPEERNDGFSAGDPERPPVCATDHYQQILYGHPATAPDRLASVAGSLRSEMLRANALLNQSSLDSGGPTADYKMLCGTGGQIDIQSFTAAGSSFTQVVTGAQAAGFDDPNVDYTIFYDDPASNACGVGSYYNDDRLIAGNRSNSGGGYGVTYSSCWYGTTPMHENGHNEGAVQNGAPYSTGTGGHCWDEEDVMCYAPDGGDLHQEGTIERCTDKVYFDCGFDTYFDSAPEAGEYLASHWNIGSSLNRFIVFGSGNTTTSNTPPGASFDVSCDQLTCTFTDTSTDSDGTIMQRSWDFGDHGSSSEGAPVHQFASAGTYPVTVTVTDNGGVADSVTRNVKVGASEPSGLRLLRAGSSKSAHSGTAGSWDYYSVKVHRRDRSLHASISGPVCRLAACDPDLDLYVRRGSAPTFNAFACRPRLVGSNESCEIKRPHPGRWIVGVHVYAASAAADYSVEASVKGPPRRWKHA